VATVSLCNSLCHAFFQVYAVDASDIAVQVCCSSSIVDIIDAHLTSILDLYGDFYEGLLGGYLYSRNACITASNEFYNGLINSSVLLNHTNVSVFLRRLSVSVSQ
jgi:hypothetical protein